MAAPIWRLKDQNLCRKNFHTKKIVGHKNLYMIFNVFLPPKRELFEYSTDFWVFWGRIQDGGSNMADFFEKMINTLGTYWELR